MGLFWKNVQNQKKFFDNLYTQLGYKCMDDWYNVTKVDVHKNGGAGVLRHYKGSSPSLALLNVYPEHNWEIERFEHKPLGFWKIKDNQKRFCDQLFTQLGYKSMDDWYKVTHEDFIKNGGKGLLDKYNGSHSSALHGVYPEHNWNLKRFKKIPTGLWSQESQKTFFDHLYAQLGYKSMDDWYKVTVEDINKYGGIGLLSRYYNSSPSLALQSVYPKHNWELERFKNKPSKLWNKNITERHLFEKAMFMEEEDSMTKGFWDKFTNNRDNVLKTMEWLGKQLSIESLNDWYRVHLKTAVMKYVPIGSNQTLCKLLEIAYPHHQWNLELFGGKKTLKSQLELRKAIEQLFPTHRSFVQEDYRHPKLRHSSGHEMELDVYIEPLKLAFEYQGEQHYIADYWTGRDFPQQQKRDEEKREMCKQHGITLIEIPYWWNRTLESLSATIHQVRSDSIREPPGVEPIQAEMIYTDVSPFLSLLSHGYTWDGVQDVTGWWMTEKMDGVRGYWNGEKLLSRHTKNISCPSWFISSLPNLTQLDGELWMGRGTTHVHVTMVLNSKDSSDWSQIGYYVFDIPSSSGTYEDRMEQMESIKRSLPPHVHVVKNIQRQGTDHLQAYLDSIVSEEGEGLMLRKPQTRNETGYTSSILKAKKYEDTEVEVVGVVESGLVCRQSNGIECVVRDINLDSPLPPLGSVIVVKHMGIYSSGLLRDPVYWRPLKSIHDEERKTEAPDWRSPSNHKDFFDQMARAMNISQPSDWYRVKREDVVKQGGQMLLQEYYGNSLYKALTHSFPDLQILPWIIDGNVPNGYWVNTGNQRIFFDWLMACLGYKCMEDWYNVTGEDILKNGGGTLLYHYNSSPSVALQSVYPEHKWEMQRFKNKPTMFWLMGRKKQQQQYIDWLSNQLSYKCMEDWYKLTVDDILKNGGEHLLTHFNNSPSKLLQSVYPEHNWELERFSHKPKGFWKSKDNQKKFFDNLYTELRHECMDDWYKVTREDLFKSGGATLLSHYKNSPSLALHSVYPEHKWELHRFKHKLRGLGIG